MSSRVSISFKEAAADAISFAGKSRLGRVQRADTSANLPNTPIQELGSNKLVGRIFDIPEITVNISSIDVGARSAFLMAGIDWANAADGEYIEAQDMKYVSLSQVFKANGTNDIARTLFVPGAKLDRYSLNYSVGGDSTEEFSFMGTTQYWLKYDVDVFSGTIAGGQLTGFSGARQLKNGSYILCAFASGVGYLPEEAITASSATSATFDPDAVADGTPVLVAFHKDMTDQWNYTYEYPNVAPGYSPPPDQAVGTRGWAAEIYLVQSGVASERIFRGQTCSVQAQYQTTKVQELGNERIVGYSDGIPDVTGTLEIMTHDFELGMSLSGDLVGDNWSPNELGLGNWGLLIRVWRRGADRLAELPEKTVWLPAIEITQEQNNLQVGQDARQTFSFTSKTNEVYIFKGNKPSGFWGR